MIESTMSLRVAGQQWLNPQLNDRVIDLLARTPAIREVALFTQWTHSPLRFAELEARSVRLADAIAEYRAAGVRVGINHLSTIGHLDEDVDSTDTAVQHLVDTAGAVSGSGVCFRDPRVASRVASDYRLLASTRPDFIWIDDDIRLEGHFPIGFACFCPRCLREFEAETGGTWDRADLVAAFDAPPQADRLELRRAWLAHNRRYVSDVLRAVRAAVDTVDAGIPVGFMTSPLAYSGAGYAEWARALGAPERPVKIRPGAGFYTDDVPLDLLRKLHAIGAQAAPLLDLVPDVQYELDSFPYLRLNKSITMTVAEMAGAVAVGCTGWALHAMGMSADPIDEFDDVHAAIQDASVFLERAVATFGRSEVEGVGIEDSPDAFAAWNVDSGWLSSGHWVSDAVPLAWSALGIPFGYGPSRRTVTLLRGDAVLTRDDDALRALLAGAVVADGRAVEHLVARGLGDLVGFRVAGHRRRDVREIYTDDILATGFAGWTRDARQGFWGEPSMAIEPTESGARVLSRLADYQDRDLGAGSGVFENAQGGRVVVLGYSPWTAMDSLAASTRLGALLRWVSRETLPAYVETHARAALWVRRDTAGRPALMVLNASADRRELTIRMREVNAEMTCWRMDGSGESAPIGDQDVEGYTAVRLPTLGAWEAALVSAGAIA